MWPRLFQALRHYGVTYSGISKLTVEKFDRNNKAGYALMIQRGEENINVSATEGQFLYAGELLRHLSLSEAWVEHPEK